MSKRLFVSLIRLGLTESLGIRFAQVPQTRLILNRQPTKYINPSRSFLFSPSFSFPSFQQSYPSAIPLQALPDGPLGHVIIPCPPEVNLPSTEQKVIARTRPSNIFKDVWRQHKRVNPLGESPGVRKSIIAIFKSSCEHLPVRILPPSDLLVLCLS